MNYEKKKKKEMAIFGIFYSIGTRNKFVLKYFNFNFRKSRSTGVNEGKHP